MEQNTPNRPVAANGAQGGAQGVVMGTRAARPVQSATTGATTGPVTNTTVPTTETTAMHTTATTTSTAVPTTEATTAQTTVPTAPVMPESEPAKVAGRDGEKKKSQGMMAGMIVCAVLALGGVGFGIWAMIDGNAKVDKLNTEVASLKNENTELTQQIADMGGAVDAMAEAKEWSTTEVRGGVFYVLDEKGETVAQSEASWPAISEVKDCKASAEDTLLTCTVNTAEGEATLIYDAIGNSFGLVTGPNE